MSEPQPKNKDVAIEKAVGVFKEVKEKVELTADQLQIAADKRKAKEKADKERKALEDQKKKKEQKRKAEHERIKNVQIAHKANLEKGILKYSMNKGARFGELQVHGDVEVTIKLDKFSRKSEIQEVVNKIIMAINEDKENEL